MDFSISGPAYSVNITTGRRLAVPDTYLSQPESVFDIVPTCALVMSESSRAPIMLKLPTMQDDSLHPSYNHDVLVHTKVEFDHSPCAYRDAAAVLGVRIARAVPDQS